MSDKISVGYLLCEAAEGRVPRKRYPTLFCRTILSFSIGLECRRLPPHDTRHGRSAVKRRAASDVVAETERQQVAAPLRFSQCRTDRGFRNVAGVVRQWPPRRHC